MIKIHLDMIQSIGLAIILLLIGRKMRVKIQILKKYCIPSPVIGGFIFAILTLILKQLNLATFIFDTTLQTFFMTMFFTSVGFNASYKVLKTGGIKVLIFLIVSTGLIFVQNIGAVLLAKPLGINPLLALMTGSTAMTGGHGTSASISPLIENYGIASAQSVAIAAATFGLIAGSAVGGPVARRLITKYDLLKNYKVENEVKEDVEKEEDFFNKKESILNGEKFATAFFMILLSMAFGTFFNYLFKLLGLNFPYYLGPMIVAAIIRNITDVVTQISNSPIEEIKIIENIALNLFLSMALMTLRLWDLIDLALPITVLLLAQLIFTVLYTRYITFYVMGADYDGAVICAGHCGFGMGATPNGITNMETVCDSYEYSKIAFFVVPLVGALFIDFVNVSIITGFITYFR
ncbi:sodium/glutamate symporter [Caviibacter abscessus]|uniref:sodium/glutamate symporter n=1 Tax=Caviibacter abscessus TaxID=1766719 RepID=UPI000832969B|nr:sodium/glutamate symporter [Caviibacter abscessus]